MNHITAHYLVRSIQEDRLREAEKRRRLPEPDPTVDPYLRPRRSWAAILRIPRLQPSKG